MIRGFNGNDFEILKGIIDKKCRKSFSKNYVNNYLSAT